MQGYYVTVCSASHGDDRSSTRTMNSGQVIFTGDDDVAVRSYSGIGNDNDGLCIFSTGEVLQLRGRAEECCRGNRDLRRQAPLGGGEWRCGGSARSGEQSERRLARACI